MVAITRIAKLKLWKDDNITMKKVVYLTGSCAILCLMLASCGIPKPPTEKRIMADLPNNLTTISVGNPLDAASDIQSETKVISLVIEKRQTNEKDDVVYCVLDLENQYFHFTKYVVLHYIYYDQGGWILDDWEYYKDSSYLLLNNPIDENSIKQKWLGQYDTADVVDCILNADNSSITFSLQVSTQHENASVNGRVLDTYTFVGTHWNENSDTSDISTYWDVVGRWVYVSEGTYVNACDIKIITFDQEAMIATGSCEFYYPSFWSGQWYQEGYTLDVSNASIEVTPGGLTLGWPNSDIFYIGLDDATCNFRGTVGRTSLDDLDRVKLEQTEKASNKVVDYTVDVPAGFKETDAGGLDKAWINADNSNINVNITEKNTAFESITVDALREAMVLVYGEDYSATPTITDKYFTNNAVCGMPAYQYCFEIELMSAEMTQLIVCIDADQTYTITYTDTTGDWIKDFEASAKNIQLTFE